MLGEIDVHRADFVAEGPQLLDNHFEPYRRVAAFAQQIRDGERRGQDGLAGFMIGERRRHFDVRRHGCRARTVGV
jgi:hypothetical protein